MKAGGGGEKREDFYKGDRFGWGYINCGTCFLNVPLIRMEDVDENYGLE